MRFFFALLYVIFVAPEFRDENRKCKLAAVSLRFVAAMFQRFRNSMQLGAIWWKTEVKIARGLHLQQKLQ